jgi:hypothetical protein
MRAVDNTDSRYVRAGGKGSIRIRYRRIGVGWKGKKLDAKMEGKISRIAYIICTLAPDEADIILERPSRRVGRVLRAVLRRTQEAVRRRRLRRRPTSCVVRA